jgi:hypothetical protein
MWFVPGTALPVRPMTRDEKPAGNRTPFASGDDASGP